VIEETLRIPSGRLSLEARMAYQDAAGEPAGKVLICPAHPFLGGDMDNKLLACLAAVLVQAGFVVLRFNYRGIGGSEIEGSLDAAQAQFWEQSTCPDYEADIHADCRSTLAYLAAALDPGWPLLLVGYSFGCLPVMALAEADQRIGRTALISPPLVQWPADSIAMKRVVARGVFFAPGDFACPEQRMMQFYQRMAEPKTLRTFPDADHFFIGQETRLAESVREFMQPPR